MPEADILTGAGGQSSVDLLIVGGGIMGLWAALKAERLGINTLLVDAGVLGQGASGGVLGALMAHAPERWNPKKQFQFTALIALEEEIDRLEAESGLKSGYRRCGRIIPLPTAHHRVTAERQALEAKVNWQATGHDFRWEVFDRPMIGGWPSADVAAHGIVHDTLAGRVSPRQLLAVLITLLRRAKHVRIVENSSVAALQPNASSASLSDGGTVVFGHCLIAAGHQSFPLLQGLGEPTKKPLGMPVKGQAALMKAEGLEDRPLIFRDGLYVVPHDDGIVAIGSTSENSFSSADDTDAQLETLIAEARRIAPVLTDAPVIARWAGLRPKAIGRDPMIGPHPAHSNILAFTGGFKVSFGVAHQLADAVLALVGDRTTDLPASFLFSAHLESASR